MKVPRDLTRDQFLSALRKRGFRKVLLWIEDTSGACPGVSWGIVIRRGTGGIMRRATLAKVIQEREAEIAKRDRAAARAA
jgi:hypothetical protein